MKPRKTTQLPMWKSVRPLSVGWLPASGFRERPWRRVLLNEWTSRLGGQLARWLLSTHSGGHGAGMVGGDGDGRGLRGQHPP